VASRHELINISGESGNLHDQHLTHVPVLVLHAHTSCNCRCVMCDIWKTKETRSLRPPDLEPHIESIRRLGVRWVVFSGGEPLLNREWPQLCLMLQREQIRLTLLTTGLLLEKYAAQIAESFDDVIVSLDGPEKVHNAIRRMDKAFSMLQSGAAAIRCERPSFAITARNHHTKSESCLRTRNVSSCKQLNLNGISFLAADLTSEAFNRPVAWSSDRRSEVALSVEKSALLRPKWSR